MLIKGVEGITPHEVTISTNAVVYRAGTVTIAPILNTLSDAFVGKLGHH